MRTISGRITFAAGTLALSVAVTSPASALELSDLAPLLAEIPSEILSYSGQGVDDDGRVYIDGVRVNVPNFGIVSADRLSLGDIDLDSIIAGEGPAFIDLRIDGLRISRNTYLGAAPWPFQADVLTGEVAFAYTVLDQEPGAIEGSLSVDFGADGRITGAIAMLEPDWYRDEMRAEDRLPEIGRRVLPRQASLHVAGIEIDGDALAGMSGGHWPGSDVTLGLDFEFSASDIDDGVAISAAVRSNLADLSASANGFFGALMRDEFNEDLRSGDSFVDLIEWTRASLSYEDQGLADALLAIAMAAQQEPTMMVLADALEELSRNARELEGDSPALDLLDTVRRVLLNYGTYAGDRISISVRPVAPVSFSLLGDLRVEPANGLHPDDLIGLLRLRHSYQSR